MKLKSGIFRICSFHPQKSSQKCSCKCLKNLIICSPFFQIDMLYNFIENSSTNIPIVQSTIQLSLCQWALNAFIFKSVRHAAALFYSKILSEANIIYVIFFQLNGSSPFLVNPSHGRRSRDKLENLNKFRITQIFC